MKKDENNWVAQIDFCHVFGQRDVQRSQFCLGMKDHTINEMEKTMVICHSLLSLSLRLRYVSVLFS